MTLRIDARGLRCPWPSIRLARALRENHRSIEITADDPAAERELTAVAEAAGADIEAAADGAASLYRIVVRGTVNVSFTRVV
jgi:tRNA 2-thiouridine synthesizing protein A